MTNTTTTRPHDPRAAQVRLLLDARETSKALGVSEKTLWSKTRPRGTIPCIRIGKRVLYAVADLERWIGQQTTEGGREA